MNMSKLIVLGTGNAMVTNCYNTCFAVSCTNGEHILVDAGGGNGILVQMKKAKVEPNTIHHLIVTHEHCDHLLGVVWVVRKIGTMMLGNKYAGQLHIYCHPALCETIVTLATLTLQKKFVNLFGDRIILHSIENGTKMELADQKVEFFDISGTIYIGEKASGIILDNTFYLLMKEVCSRMTPDTSASEEGQQYRETDTMTERERQLIEKMKKAEKQVDAIKNPNKKPEDYLGNRIVGLVAVGGYTFEQVYNMTMLQFNLLLQKYVEIQTFELRTALSPYISSDEGQGNKFWLE